MGLGPEGHGSEGQGSEGHGSSFNQFFHSSQESN